MSCRSLALALAPAVAAAWGATKDKDVLVSPTPGASDGDDFDFEVDAGYALAALTAVLGLLVGYALFGGPSAAAPSSAAPATTRKPPVPRAKRPKPRVLCLFDVDGTLTAARKQATPEVIAFLEQLRATVCIGMIGGSDLVKQKEQLAPDVVDMFDYTFAENGLDAWEDGKPTAKQSFAKHLGEPNLKKLINWVLHYFSTIDVPVKRGTFIEFRAGMLNVSPVGRNCSQEERDAFEVFDNKANVRKTMVAKMQKEFKDLDLTFSIGGQISFDVFPKGWDKTYCLQFVDPKAFDEIHFFGDKCFKGGNDHEIFSDKRTVGHEVTCPQDTIKACTELFL